LHKKVQSSFSRSVAGSSLFPKIVIWWTYLQKRMSPHHQNWLNFYFWWKATAEHAVRKNDDCTFLCKTLYLHLPRFQDTQDIGPGNPLIVISCAGKFTCDCAKKSRVFNDLCKTLYLLHKIFMGWKVHSFMQYSCLGLQAANLVVFMAYKFIWCSSLSVTASTYHNCSVHDRLLTLTHTSTTTHFSATWSTIEVLTNHCELHIESKRVRASCMRFWSKKQLIKSKRK